MIVEVTPGVVVNLDHFITMTLAERTDIHEKPHVVIQCTDDVSLELDPSVKYNDVLDAIATLRTTYRATSNIPQ